MFKGSEVKWAEVVAELRRRVIRRAYEDRLPSVRELAREFGTTKATIEKAVRHLESRAVLTVRNRAGIYVRRVPFYVRRLVGEVFLEHDLVLAGEVEEGGLFERMTGATEDVQVTPDYHEVPASERVAELLGIDPGTTVLERTWLYVADGEPYQLARSYVPLHVAAAAEMTGPEAERKGIGTQWQLARIAGLDIRYMRRELEPRMPEPEEETLLALPPGMPVMDRWSCIRTGDGTPVEAGVMTSSRVRFIVDLDLQERTAR